MRRALCEKVAVVESMSEPGYSQHAGTLALVIFYFI